MQLEAIGTFANSIQPNKLYAAFASYHERGGRDYWLLLTSVRAPIALPPACSLSSPSTHPPPFPCFPQGKAYKAKKAIKMAGGTTIQAKAWVVDARWYLSTSDYQGRKSYKLLEEKMTLAVKSMVQERELAWEREGRAGAGSESLLSRASHVALMSHNYSNLA